VETPLGSNGGIGKRLLTPKEAAEFLGLQVDTVYKKSRLRELPLGQGWQSVAVRPSGTKSLR
jgi:hypothetical protein